MYYLLIFSSISTALFTENLPFFTEIKSRLRFFMMSRQPDFLCIVDTVIKRLVTKDKQSFPDLF